MQYRFSGLSPILHLASCRLVPVTTAITALVAALSVTSAHAANALASAQVSISPAFESATIRLNISGDDNRNAGGNLRYRVQGQTTWQTGHRFVRSLPTRLNSLLFNLRESTTYEVEVTPIDPEGTLAPITTTFTTRTTPKPGIGRALYVSPTGSPAPTGSQTAPFGLVTDALKAAQPGDTVYLLPGTYREWVYNAFKSGLPGAPITIKGAPGVVFRGDAPALAEPHTTRLWTRQADGTWATPFPCTTYYAAMNGTRLYHYKTQAELLAAKSAGKTGWWQDSAKRICVALPEGTSPDTVSMQVAQTDKAFTLMGVHDLIIDGLEIGFYGTTDAGIGIYLNNCHDITIRNCNIHNVSFPIFMKAGSSRNLMENNTITDKGLEAWTWSQIKGTDAEGAGIMIDYAGTGNVVRRNTITGVFNGVCSIGGGEMSADTDVYYNWIHDVGDDGIEPDGSAVDFRAWCNTVRGAQNPVSLAPVGIGPAWIMYNTLSDFHEAGIKVGNDGYGPVMVYHNTVVTTNPGVIALTPWNAMRNFTVRNNILVSTSYVIHDMYTTGASNTTLDNDLLYTTDTGRFVKFSNTRYYNLSQFQASGQERKGVTGNPQFTGASWGDFRLQSTSPARHRAEIIPGINDFFGTTPDIGSLQMGK